MSSYLSLGFNNEPHVLTHTDTHHMTHTLHVMCGISYSTCGMIATQPVPWGGDH